MTLPLRASFLLLGLLLSVPAAAQSPRPIEAPDHRLLIHNATGIRLNPIGLEDQFRLGYQRVLYRSDSLLFRDNYAYLGASVRLNPAGYRVGPMLEVQPLSILTLRAVVDVMGFFSTFNAVQSFTSPNQEYSDARLAQGGAAKENYSTRGAHFLFEPLLSFKAGSLLLRNRFSLDYWSMNLREGDRVFYDPTPDMLLPNKGFTIGNEADLLFVGVPSVLVGLRHTLLNPLYGASNYAEGEAATRNNAYQRLGLVAAYIFKDEPYTGFNRPTLLLNVAWYLQHRYRTGAETSQTVPYLSLVFAFQSDLLGASPKR